MMAREESMIINFPDDTGGGRAYIKKEWLHLLGVDLEKRDSVDLPVEIDYDSRTILLKKLPD